MHRGTLELSGKWIVRNGIVKSNNHLVILDPVVSKRIRNKDNRWMPIPLAMAFIRERGNVIDYEIPISGNFNDPKFHLRDAIVDVLENIFIKPATTPYRLKVKNIEKEIEKSLSLRWEMRGSTLNVSQKKFIKKTGVYLLKNPEASIEVSPHQYALKEKEYILFFETKKKYYMSMPGNNHKTVDADALEKIEQMSVKDSSFYPVL